MINIAVEGASDEGMARAVAKGAGHDVGKVVIAGGASRLDPKIQKYNAAAKRMNWVVFRDSDGGCPVRLRHALTEKISTWSPRFSIRIAHSMTEAWLLADRDGFAEFFQVRPADVPPSPEEVPHAKRALLTACRRSRSRNVRKAMVTDDGHVGPLYVATINEFASGQWNVNAAAMRSHSLARAIAEVRGLP